MRDLALIPLLLALAAPMALLPGTATAGDFSATDPAVKLLFVDDDGRDDDDRYSARRDADDDDTPGYAYGRDDDDDTPDYGRDDDDDDDARDRHHDRRSAS